MKKVNLSINVCKKEARTALVSVEFPDGNLGEYVVEKFYHHGFYKIGVI